MLVHDFAGPQNGICCVSQNRQARHEQRSRNDEAQGADPRRIRSRSCHRRATRSGQSSHGRRPGVVRAPGARAPAPQTSTGRPPGRARVLPWAADFAVEIVCVSGHGGSSERSQSNYFDPAEVVLPLAESPHGRNPRVQLVVGRTLRQNSMPSGAREDAREAAGGALGLSNCSMTRPRLLRTSYLMRSLWAGMFILIASPAGRVCSLPFPDDACACRRPPALSVLLTVVAAGWCHLQASLRSWIVC